MCVSPAILGLVFACVRALLLPAPGFLILIPLESTHLVERVPAGTHSQPSAQKQRPGNSLILIYFSSLKDI